MAIINFASHARRNAEAHNAANTLVSRQPIGYTEDGTPVVNPLPTSVKVLTAFFVILGVLIVGEYLNPKLDIWARSDHSCVGANQALLHGELLSGGAAR